MRHFTFTVFAALLVAALLVAAAPAPAPAPAPECDRPAATVDALPITIARGFAIFEPESTAYPGGVDGMWNMSYFIKYTSPEFLTVSFAATDPNEIIDYVYDANEIDFGFTIRAVIALPIEWLRLIPGQYGVSAFNTEEQGGGTIHAVPWYWNSTTGYEDAELTFTFGDAPFNIDAYVSPWMYITLQTYGGQV